MKLYTVSVFVDDQSKALEFYTKTLGFLPKHDKPIGDDRWITVVSSEEPDGVELLLERGKALHARIPQSTFETLPGVGHLPQLEGPELVLDRLLEVFSEGR